MKERDTSLGTASYAWTEVWTTRFIGLYPKIRPDSRNGRRNKSGEASHVKIDSEATAYIVNNIANRRRRGVPSVLDRMF
jgi:hypothetical protein